MGRESVREEGGEGCEGRGRCGKGRVGREGVREEEGEGCEGRGKRGCEGGCFETL